MRRCEIDGCEREHRARGLCTTHWQRWRRNGDPEARQVAPKGSTFEKRFELYVDKTDTCWLWTGATDKDGYGQAMLGRRKVKAHRASYETFVGPIPEGLHIDHLCLVKNCVNPRHLEPVTLAENNRRRHRVEALAKRQEDTDGE